MTCFVADVWLYFSLCSPVGDYSVKVDEVYFNGKHLEENSSLLSDYGVQHMCTFEVKKFLLYKAETFSIKLTDIKTDEKRLSWERLFDFEEACGPLMD